MSVPGRVEAHERVLCLAVHDGYDALGDVVPPELQPLFGGLHTPLRRACIPAFRVDRDHKETLQVTLAIRAHHAEVPRGGSIMV